MARLVFVDPVRGASRFGGAACDTDPAEFYEEQHELGVVIAVSLWTYPTIGAFVASRRPENLIGWILCGVGLRFVIEGFAVVYVG